jgi:hypothetical protein
LGEFAREDPGDVLEGLRADLRFENGGGEKGDRERLAMIGVAMFDLGDRNGAEKGYVEFFAKFASKSSLEGFAGFDRATRELPFEWR